MNTKEKIERYLTEHDYMDDYTEPEDLETDDEADDAAIEALSNLLNSLDYEALTPEQQGYFDVAMEALHDDHESEDEDEMEVPDDEMEVPEDEDEMEVPEPEVEEPYYKNHVYEAKAACKNKNKGKAVK